MSVKFGDSSLPWESSSDVQFGLPPQAETPNVPLPAADAVGSADVADSSSPVRGPGDSKDFPAAMPTAASFGSAPVESSPTAFIAPSPQPIEAPGYVDSPLFDEFDANDDSDELLFGSSGPVLESPLPGELSTPLSLPSFVGQHLSAEMEDDEEFQDFNEEDFDEEFDDDFEEEEDDFDYGEQELEGDGEESDDESGADLGPDGVPDAEFED